ncbi:hypothetical protein F7725_005146 [Dissostichus mawsoni]|uniref:Uncharacterized protein n=1 Tax=Dissostichus mawsoni TaxID=36200 RepID=A0A7J5YS85_DISMA|nr:hypothetical protein F7725_005146 [Dissostichus mawsoni]
MKVLNTASMLPLTGGSTLRDRRCPPCHVWRHVLADITGYDDIDNRKQQSDHQSGSSPDSWTLHDSRGPDHRQWQCLNVVDALMLMFAAYYCVNISYRSELELPWSSCRGSRSIRTR